MLKKSKVLGKNTSAVEVQNITRWGIWFLIDDKEYFLSFEDYPELGKATIDQIYEFEFYHGNHLHWPSLDVDVELDALEYPEKYPLQYKR